MELGLGLILRLADEVTVLDFGRWIGGGIPEQAQEDPAVIRAYLGTYITDEMPKTGGTSLSDGRGLEETLPRRCQAAVVSGGVA
ncbi:hypothetical protein [Streptomyces sp. CWNU-1]|uniref:Branched-chain amino acid ATP-binding cassette transporter C-terminal domain-containing protein n=1 Tax=Streptomyces albipurpureus TaxID=2897419 RepID=A0ABT0UYA1_9ACTN|nr:hypothetical protein [Streptomyces sp. CWNU-1]